ncbi:MAG: phenylalanine--tRNA ligase subunit alpha [Clostridiales bacterium]|nr:phenylalanine--tRNA ligase subunit alpha [Clostridiales bacterium]
MEILDNILKEFDIEYLQCKTMEECNALRVKYLGKSGKVTEALKEIKNVPNDEKKAYGESVNKLKVLIEGRISDLNVKLEEEAYQKELEDMERVDLTVPAKESRGSLHPITITQHKIEEVFKSMGFIIEDGNEIETEYNNFEAVNIPKNHPARDMQDTFYLANGQVLKTHTSARQNYIMRKYGAPLKAIFPGRCFRNEELDASHENTFFQLEGMMIDKDISISNLIYFMKTMLSSVFGREVKVRLRPGFFPFVEPGFELDCSCPYCGGSGCGVCKRSGWIELCPCGMIHPKVLEMGGIDPNEYQGFAFGLGLSRMAMMNFEINDIRVLNGGKLKTLKSAHTK